MNDFDLPELWRLLEELEEGALEPSLCDELAALLNRSPAARRAYLEYFQQSAVLRMEAAKLNERRLLPGAGAAVKTRRTFLRPVLAAAALVALIATLIAVTRPKPAARLAAVVAAETRWSIDGMDQGSGDEPVSVVEGSTVRVLSGTAKLQLESGELLVVQGPAEVEFPTLHRPQLRSGWLWIDSKKSGQTFMIEAGKLRVRNIGTRFGVRVADDGQVEVHLVTGRVEVLAPGSRKPLADLAKSGKAFVFAPEGGIEEISLASDPFPVLPELLQQAANYRATILGQSPVGYWRLDDAAGDGIANEIPGNSPGFKARLVRGREPGLGPSKGFHGFSPGNHSLYLNGSRDFSVVIGIDGPHGVNRREGAVSFWIRRAADETPRDEMLWLAGIGDEVSRIPLQAILHTRLTASGHVVLEIENGDDDVTLSSSRNIADGRWHQVVASWGPMSVDLFIDGRLVARDNKPRAPGKGNFRGRYVRFGKPSFELNDKFGSYTGWVDEIALWDRPLSPTEVDIQFQSATGSAEN